MSSSQVTRMDVSKIVWSINVDITFLWFRKNVFIEINALVKNHVSERMIADNVAYCLIFHVKKYNPNFIINNQEISRLLFALLT